VMREPEWRRESFFFFSSFFDKRGKYSRTERSFLIESVSRVRALCLLWRFKGSGQEEEGYGSMHKRNWNMEAKREMIDFLTLIGFGPEWRRQSTRCCFVPFC
jgi:hypothetical protein